MDRENTANVRNGKILSNSPFTLIDRPIIYLLSMRRKVSTLSEQVVKCICACDIEELGSLSEDKIAKSLCTLCMSKNFEIDNKLPISRFILREKMYRSVLVLEKKIQIPINELSKKLGFGSVNQFACEFIKFFAIDPWEYRKIKMK